MIIPKYILTSQVPFYENFVPVQHSFLCKYIDLLICVTCAHAGSFQVLDLTICFGQLTYLYESKHYVGYLPDKPVEIQVKWVWVDGGLRDAPSSSSPVGLSPPLIPFRQLFPTQPCRPTTGRVKRRRRKKKERSCLHSSPILFLIVYFHY